MRILVTGSRTWDDSQVIRDALLKAATDVEHMSDVLVVHGDAPGADQLAAQIAERLGMMTEAHPANWDSCGPDCNEKHWRYRYGKPYCPRSGFIRNDTMVKLGADVCLAFNRNRSTGTDMCAKLATKAGIPVEHYMFDDNRLV